MHAAYTTRRSLVPPPTSRHQPRGRRGRAREHRVSRCRNGAPSVARRTTTTRRLGCARRARCSPLHGLIARITSRCSLATVLCSDSAGGAPHPLTRWAGQQITAPHPLTRITLTHRRCSARTAPAVCPSPSPISHAPRPHSPARGGSYAVRSPAPPALTLSPPPPHGTPPSRRYARLVYRLASKLPTTFPRQMLTSEAARDGARECVALLSTVIATFPLRKAAANEALAGGRLPDSHPNIAAELCTRYAALVRELVGAAETAATYAPTAHTVPALSAAFVHSSHRGLCTLRCVCALFSPWPVHCVGTGMRSSRCASRAPSRSSPTLRRCDILSRPPSVSSPATSSVT
jgi:hypothetical protein